MTLVVVAESYPNDLVVPELNYSLTGMRPCPVGHSLQGFIESESKLGRKWGVVSQTPMPIPLYIRKYNRLCRVILERSEAHA